MKKHITVITLLLSVIIFAQQEEQPKKHFWDNVRIGGGIGLGFGNNSTTIAIAPSAVYDFNKYFSMGLGLGYQFNKRGNFKANIFNLGLISLYNPFQGLQLSAEFEQNFINTSYLSKNTSYNYPSLYLGAGYSVHRNIAIGLRYDVLYDKNKSIYGSPYAPFVRVFF